MRDEALTILCFTAAPAALTFVGMLAFNWLLAPSRIYRDQEVKIKALQDDCEKALIDKAKFDELSALRQKGVDMNADHTNKTKEDLVRELIFWIDGVTAFLRQNFSDALADRFYSTGEVANKSPIYTENIFFRKGQGT